MPELPEVETVMRGLAPHVVGRRIVTAVVRQPRLRWPVPGHLAEAVRDAGILALARRGKYLLMQLEVPHPECTLLLHLGMSGSLRLCPAGQPAAAHEHLDLVLDDGRCLRLKDPRRFGAVLLARAGQDHALLAGLGVEPLSDAFDGACLHALCRGRRSAIKTLLMDAHMVAGIGNIYANEALFHAGIDPRRPAGRLSRRRCDRLAAAIRDTLTRAIEAGGSSLRDFVDGHGRPGYFQHTYQVYGRAGAPCRACGTPVRQFSQGMRSSYVCPRCQR